MTFAASVSGDEKIRLFVGFSLACPDRERISAWQRLELAGAPVSLVRPDQLHFTIAFLGATPTNRLREIADVIDESTAGVEPMPLAFRRYRETRSVGMLAFDDPSGEATRVARAVQLGLERLGVYELESRAWLAHVTVCRFRRSPGLRPQLPDLGEISPSGVAAYHSILRRDGAQYDVLHSVALGGRC